ncbi:MAG TPA: alpha/beta hydrolase [Gordonia polyisoprenivorans]|uniref:Alpha/beta fold hydrolase n=1 Tax=Gordonia polyisoprenivorans TaxID=84595 RepID=A0A846WIN4_9ACTN|nr:alpha/beta fold hydrolase [Gordonia polyisoprenivorans]NKY00753.1 alpha/beta fold hydrolase [Gordonia polyisoprenivorans]OZC33509.1 alpha/beta hydrolase [Gordonia polyisoprenivorans]UZF56926.1 alpha/beta fold hydrolase [Gordonia polyisoprenivorans]WCB38013.1 alpha/beta fold hydrolase [Gordonia polyisoprenivorans]HCS56825.1 alpha/beta hydrolase [Gordonia polyisoprenivorans]
MDVSFDATRRELTTDKGVLRYHEAGAADAPPLILLHGSGPGVTGWRNYRGNLGFFAQTHHCYVIEFPGFGVSDAWEGMPVLTAGKSVITFMDALGIASAPMIGNSMGGVVGVNLAIRKPDRVEKLVTIGGVGPNLFSPSPSEGLRLLQEFADDPDRDKLVRWLTAMVYDRTLVTEELISERWEVAMNPDALATARTMYGSASFEMQQQFMATADIPPYWAMMHKISCPTLLTWGRDDRVSPPDMALAPMRLIPDAQLHVFPRCGHWVMIEAKEAFEATVAAFLAS